MKSMWSENMGIHRTRTQGTKIAQRGSQGFTLIASLLMLLLLSGIAIGLLMMVNTEGKVGGTDLQNNLAYHAAEGGIEKMSSDLAAVFQNAQSPTSGDICSAGGPAYGGSVSNEPVMVGVTWTDYQVTPGQVGYPCPAVLPKPVWGQISGGPEANLYAQVIPVNLQATAAMLGGQQVSMTRSAQVALIPVFQFGVFCEDDCSFFNNPTIDFAGRLHANGDLYLGVGSGYKLTFHNKLEAFGNVVTNNLPNTLSASSVSDTGNVYIPTAEGDCPYPGSASGTCVLLSATGSVTGVGGAPPTTSYNTAFNIATYASSYNSAFNTFSSSVNHELINGDYGNKTSGQIGTGAKLLSLPFVSGSIHDYELIRRPTAGVADNTSLAQSREYNMAQIRVLLSDDPADLPGGASDANNVRLANLSAAQAQAQSGNATATATNQWGITIPSGNFNSTTFGTPGSGNTYNLYFAAASNVVPTSSQCTTSASCAMDWPYGPYIWTNPSPTLQGLQPANPTPTAVGAVNAPDYQVPPSGAPALQTGLCPPNTYPLGTGVIDPTGCPTVPAYPFFAPPNPVGLTNYSSGSTTSWSLIDGYLRVEYIDASGVWHPVTNEWLQLGFARGLTPPTAPGTNPITPHAIILLQQPSDRDASGAVSSTGTAPTCTATTGSGANKKCTAWSGLVPEVIADLPQVAATGSYADWAFGLTPTTPVVSPQASATPQSLTQYNWYPINFYDAREGEPRDVTTHQSDDTCSTLGVMNAVEIDVGNLAAWLKGTIGSSGTSVDYVQQNGYVLYFSDRRGMLLNPHPPMTPTGTAEKSGDSGFEDVINPSSSANTPNGTLDTAEDVNGNGYLDSFGTANLGLGQWNDSTHNLNQQTTAATPDNPYSPRITSCGTTGRRNWVSGARHVLKLVDGALGSLPISPVPVVVNGVNYYGGFTVASENPVYIQGNYNSNANDTFFKNEANGIPGPDMTSPLHSPAAVIADTVTFLSNAWSDTNSMVLSPSQPQGNRQASANTYYRTAVASGKTMTWPHPSWETVGNNYPEGTDGGIGNFLRFLEDWQNGPSTMHYGGSMVEMFYNTYNTGAFKCCTYSVYQPPNPRDYYFDPDFTTPYGLPPGTPLFKDVETLGYRQLFTARTY